MHGNVGIRCKHTLADPRKGIQKGNGKGGIGYAEIEVWAIGERSVHDGHEIRKDAEQPVEGVTAVGLRGKRTDVIKRDAEQCKKSSNRRCTKKDVQETVLLLGQHQARGMTAVRCVMRTDFFGCHRCRPF